MHTSINKQAQVSSSDEKATAQKKNSGNATPGFEDKRPESLAQSAMQSAANHSLQAKRITQLREIADESASQQGIPVQKKATGTPVIQRAFDAWVTDAIMEDKESIAAELRNPPSGKTAWHVMLERLARLGIQEPAAADVNPLMQAIFAAVPDPAAAAAAGSSAGDERMTDDVAAKVAAANGWTAVSGQVDMDKNQSAAGKKHAPKGRVFTDGKGSFWGADNSMHASGAHWKYWTGPQKSLVYRGNVTNEAPYTAVERGAQRTKTKAAGRKAAAAAASSEEAGDE